jgi:hypothetical protein
VTCFCGQPDDGERVHRAHECLPWVSREPVAHISPEGQAIAARWVEEWDALTDDERAARNEALAQAIKEADDA